MGFFEKPNPRETRHADPTTAAATLETLRRHGLALLLAFGSLAATYYAYVTAGLHASAQTNGMLDGLALHYPVRVIRDARDVPHVRARNDADLFFAQGFVEASDRLFQMDFMRRYAYGTLAEVLGSRALPIDREQRAVDIAGIASRQWVALAPQERRTLAAFAGGVNAAIAREPLPVEFRLLLYRPQPWTPQDCLAVSTVASLELADSWHAIFARDDVWRHLGERGFDAAYPLTDARYDVALDASLRSRGAADTIAFAPVHRPMPGSNAWAAGARRTIAGRSLLANDPHLDPMIPGIWYAIDLDAPGMHVAGATIPGVPGVVLGHNERLAWGATNAQTATTGVYDSGRLDRKNWTVERFGVRFARETDVAYYRTSTEFSVPADDDPRKLALVRWPPYWERTSSIATFLALDRATDIREATRALAAYRGSPQNFVIADASGAIAYHLAGAIPEDPAWGRYVHRARDLRLPPSIVPFAQLPSTPASTSGAIVSANNKMYDTHYGRRLSPEFEPPYRAYRIAQLLNARPRYDAAYFARMQLDTFSPIDSEIARAIVRAAGIDSQAADAAALQTLSSWNGRFDPGSRAATLEHTVRLALANGGTLAALLVRMRGGQSDRDVASAVREAIGALGAPQSWGAAAAMKVEHPLSAMHFGFLNGDSLPGAGDEYTIHLQEPGFAQGFRAVWDVGAWDAGGLSLPSGESGEPGSGHYTDLARGWIDGTLEPLPFTPAAVARSTTSSLLLLP